MDFAPFIPVVWAIIGLLAFGLLIWGVIVFFIALTMRKTMNTVTREFSRFERFGDQPRRLTRRR